MHEQTKLVIHGTPITPKHLLEQLAGASFCVSFADRRQAERCIELVGEGQILLLDNGAFTHWTRGGTMDEAYIERFEAWAADIMERCPQAVAVIPDVIDGTAGQDDELVATTMLDRDRCMPVWHMHEPIARFLHLCWGWDYVAIGSSGEYARVGSPAWHARIAEMFAALDELEASGQGFRRPRLHMMRG